jgi:hypothetical protein
LETVMHEPPPGTACRDPPTLSGTQPTFRNFAGLYLPKLALDTDG